MTFLVLVQGFVIFLLPALISRGMLYLPSSFIGVILVSVVVEIPQISPDLTSTLEVPRCSVSSLGGISECFFCLVSVS